MRAKKVIAKRIIKKISGRHKRSNVAESEVINTPLRPEYLEEIEENYKCAVACNECSNDDELMAAFSASATARKRGIDNTIPEESKPNVRAYHKKITLAICKATGWTSRYNSGHRSPELNTAVGGSPTSDHRTFNRRVAGDLRFYYPSGKRVPVLKVARKALELDLPVRQSILYGTFNHFGKCLSGENPHEVRRHSSYTGEMP